MRHPFPELVIGGVLVAPFVTYAAAALIIVLLLRPLLVLVGFQRAFPEPPLALLVLYVLVLATLLLLF